MRLRPVRRTRHRADGRSDSDRARKPAALSHPKRRVGYPDPGNRTRNLPSANPSTVCAGSPTTLTLLAGNAGTTSGAATTTEFGGSVYRTGAGTGDFRHQLVFTAAELNALGLGSGDITAIAFDVTAAGTGSTKNYTISLGTASSSTLSTTFSQVLERANTAFESWMIAIPVACSVSERQM